MTMKPVCLGTILILLTLFMAGPVQAGVTVRYRLITPQKTFYQVVDYADPQHIRLETFDDYGFVHSTLKLGKRIYCSGHVGLNPGLVGAVLPTAVAKVMLVPTGRRERVAGIPGQVYHVDLGGARHEVVLGYDRNLFAAEDGLLQMLPASGLPAIFRLMRRLHRDPNRDGLAMLRFDRRFQVVTVKNGPIPDAVFTPPEGVSRLPATASLPGATI